MGGLRVTLMDETAAHSARSGVEILIAAPYREIRVPVVQVQ